MAELGEAQAANIEDQTAKINENASSDAGNNGRSPLALGNQGLEGDMSGPGPGSTGNVIAAVTSFFIPGLGQLVQGRIFAAAVQFVLAGVLWFFFLGWIVHLWSIIDAALYDPHR